MKTRSPNSFSPGEEDMPAYPDEQLVMEALGDSHLAFEQLVEQYQYRVLRTIASIVSDEQAAQDVAQETFLSAWSNLAKLKEKGRFGGWLNQIAINFSKRWLRDQHRYQEHTASFEAMISSTQEQRYKGDKLRQEIWDAIDELSEDYREAVILYYISGYSYKEISEMFSVPVSTIRGRLQEARNQLRKEFLDMVTKLQLEIDSTVHKFLKGQAEQDGVSIEGLIVRLIERYKRDIDSPEMTVRKVAKTYGPTRGAPSPDGRYISYVDWETGDLAIQELATGRKLRLTNEGSWNETIAYAEHSRWSPDGKQIVYDWFEKALYIVGLDGSKPRLLYSNEKVAWLRVYDWSPDGKQILACVCNSKSCDMALVSVADSSVRVLKSPHWGGMRFSPDGRYIVYDFPQKEGSPERDISLLSMDGSCEIPLVEHPADDYVLGWAPDGRHILFASDRTGTIDAWLVAVADGKPQGDPELVKSDIKGFEPMGFTRDGSFYYGLREGGLSDVYIAKIDPETGKILAPPKKTIKRFDGHNSFPDYSPDGKYLAYISKRGAMPLKSDPPHVLCIHDLDTGEERELWPELKRIAVPRWSPDCNSIVVGGQDYSNHWWGIYQVDTQTGDVTVLVPPFEGRKLFVHDLSPDGKALFYECIDFSANIYRILVRDLESGTERELYRPTIASNSLFLSCSPDGKWLAFVEWGEKDKLRIIPTAGGEPQDLHTYEQEDGRFAALRWTPDGKYIIFVIAQGRQKKCSLWRIPIEGGEPEKLGSEMGDHIFWLSIHTDGQYIAFHAGDGWPVEVWAMENFLPGFAASK